MKKIPYGLANFEAIKEDGSYYYVDKTHYIEKLERLGSKFIFFLRPRRFGKTLFLSMLEHYYDLNRKEQFEMLFGDTYIGKNSTPLRNSLPILRFNFSGIPTHLGIEQLEHSFDIVILGYIEVFFTRYEKHFNIPQDVKKAVLAEKSAGDMLNRFIIKMYETGVKYYLLIDEYDNFANNILMYYGKERYMRVTHHSGFLRSFFAALKSATETRSIERMFVTGVSPLVLSDVTSGFNMGDNISNTIMFNNALGFSERDVKEIVDYYIAEKIIPREQREQILQIMKGNYDNYSFSKNDKDKIYNTDMVLYFMNKYLQDKEIPNDLLDENIRMDYGKLRFLITEGDKLNGNFNIFKEILGKGEESGELVKSFSLADLINREKFRSLLYYLGLLTIKKYDYGNNFIFVIPNRIIKRLQWEYLRESVLDVYNLKIEVDLLKKEFRNLAFYGKWEKLFGYIIDNFYEATSIRDFTFHEEGIKLFMLAYLNVTPLYIVHSEPEMAGGFADIFLQKDFVTTDRTKYEAIIELKYVTKDELKKKDIDQIEKEAISQLNKYASSKKIREKLIKIVIIAGSDKLIRIKGVE